MTELNFGRPVKVFYCYAREDEDLRGKLENHLEALKHIGKITTWYDRRIEPGSKWKDEINFRLTTCDLILLLISPHFMSSDYCYGIEMQLAIERYKAGQAHIIPVILRPTDWTGTPISELQVLPTDGKPITTWRNRDEAFHDVIIDIRKVVDRLYFQKNYEQVGTDDSSSEKLDELLLSILRGNAPEPSEADKAWTRQVLQKLIEAPSTGPTMSTHPLTHSPHQLKKELNEAAALGQSVLIKIYNQNEHRYIGFGKDKENKEKPIEASQSLRLIEKTDLSDWIDMLVRSKTKGAFSDHIDGYQLIVFDYSTMD